MANKHLFQNQKTADTQKVRPLFFQWQKLIGSKSKNQFLYTKEAVREFTIRPANCVAGHRAGRSAAQM